MFYCTITIYSFRFKIGIVTTTLQFSIAILSMLKRLFLALVSISWNGVLLYCCIYSVKVMTDVN